jgi:tripartite-type tricarboxylate transporter receptor subunit TctC
MRTAALAAGSVLALLIAGTAQAQDYPEPGKAINVVVPYGPGQATDLMCRVFLEQLKETLGHPAIVVENRVGAGSSIGAAEAASEPADGYNLLCTGNATHVANPLIFTEIDFDPDAALRPITGVAATGYVFATGKNFAGKTLPEIVEAAKTADPPLKVGLASTTSRVLWGMLQQAAGVELDYVPYMRGKQDLFPDLIRGDTDLVIEAMPSAMAALSGDDVTAVAVTLPERSTLLPDTPTFEESGLDLVLVGWNAFYAPAGTPDEIVAKLNEASVAALNRPETAENLEPIACTPMPTTPEGLAEQIESDRAKWRPMVDLYNLRVN